MLNNNLKYEWSAGAGILGHKAKVLKKRLMLEVDL